MPLLVFFEFLCSWICAIQINLSCSVCDTLSASLNPFHVLHCFWVCDALKMTIQRFRCITITTNYAVVVFCAVENKILASYEGGVGSSWYYAVEKQHRTLFYTDTELKEMQVLSNRWGICFIRSDPNDRTEWRMVDSGGCSSAGGNLAFREGRNQQSKGAARLLPQRSSGLDCISKGSGWDQKKAFFSMQQQYFVLQTH